MQRPSVQHGLLPATGYLRQAQIIGEPAVTPEQAERNRVRGKGPRRPRDGSSGIVPFSSATLWRKVKGGEFPAPAKLSERVTAWRVEDVRQWLDAQAAR
jgi:prophage regulatory protein